MLALPGNYSFIAPTAMPFVKYFWKNGKITMTGRVPINAIAILTVLEGTFAMMELTSDVTDMFWDKNCRSIMILFKKFCNV